MKTSVMEVHDMLSVLSVSGVENRIGEVPGVESVTVNHAAGTATVRYDETRLNITDIKSAVRQRGNDDDAAPAGTGHEGHTASGATTAGPDAAAAHPAQAAATPAPTPATDRPAVAASAPPVTAAPAGDKKPGQAEPNSSQHDADHP